jgi:hypothetical protein
MKKLRIIIASASMVILCLSLATVNYTNMSWPENCHSYIVAISMASTFISMVCCNNYEKKRRKE